MSTKSMNLRLVGARLRAREMAEREEDDAAWARTRAIQAYFDLTRRELFDTMHPDPREKLMRLFRMH